MVGILIIVYVLFVIVLWDCIVYIYGGVFVCIGCIDVMVDSDLIQVMVFVYVEFVWLWEENGVVVLIDMYGVMFVNIVGQFVKFDNVCVLVGVNLLMFVWVVCYCIVLFDKLVDKVLFGGVKGVYEVLFGMLLLLMEIGCGQCVLILLEL